MPAPTSISNEPNNPIWGLFTKLVKQEGKAEARKPLKEDPPAEKTQAVEIKTLGGTQARNSVEIQVQRTMIDAENGTHSSAPATLPARLTSLVRRHIKGQPAKKSANVVISQPFNIEKQIINKKAVTPAERYLLNSALQKAEKQLEAVTANLTNKSGTPLPLNPDYPEAIEPLKIIIEDLKQTLGIKEPKKLKNDLNISDSNKAVIEESDQTPIGHEKSYDEPAEKSQLINLRKEVHALRDEITESTAFTEFSIKKLDTQIDTLTEKGKTFSENNKAGLKLITAINQLQASRAELEQKHQEIVETNTQKLTEMREWRESDLKALNELIEQQENTLSEIHKDLEQCRSGIYDHFGNIKMGLDPDLDKAYAYEQELQMDLNKIEANTADQIARRNEIADELRVLTIRGEVQALCDVITKSSALITASSLQIQRLETQINTLDKKLSLLHETKGTPLENLSKLQAAITQLQDRRHTLLQNNEMHQGIIDSNTQKLMEMKELREAELNTLNEAIKSQDKELSDLHEDLEHYQKELQNPSMRDKALREIQVIEQDQDKFESDTFTKKARRHEIMSELNAINALPSRTF